MTLAGDIIFILTFLLDLGILFTALLYIKSEGVSGYLSQSILFAGISAFVFGFHHIIELDYSPVPSIVGESLEFVAALLMLASAYFLFKVVQDD